MKILQGTLVETLYDWPDKAVVTPTSCDTRPVAAAMTPRNSTTLVEDEVAYMSDKVCLT